MRKDWKDIKSGAFQLTATLKFIVSHPLNSGRKLSALGRFTAWQVASRLRAEIEFEWIEGTKLIVSHGMTGATGNIYCGLHEFVEMGFLLHLLRPNDLFLDVGANIGSYTILAARVCGARVIAFEPDPGTASVLRRNIAINHLSALTDVREAALGAVDGQIAFTVGLDTMNRVARPDDKSVQIVPIGRLDDIPEAAAATLIKLDVEGFEEEVLSGASRVLASPSLLAVQSELCSPIVQDTLESFGFERRFYDPFTRTLQPTPFSYQTSNALFVRATDLVKERLAQAPSRIVGRRAL
jgi:FkbM family methyltransferase